MAWCPALSDLRPSDLCQNDILVGAAVTRTAGRCRDADGRPPSPAPSISVQTEIVVFLMLPGALPSERRLSYRAVTSERT